MFLVYTEEKYPGLAVRPLILARSSVGLMLAILGSASLLPTLRPSEGDVAKHATQADEAPVTLSKTVDTLVLTPVYTVAAGAVQWFFGAGFLPLAVLGFVALWIWKVRSKSRWASLIFAAGVPLLLMPLLGVRSDQAATFFGIASVVVGAWTLRQKIRRKRTSVLWPLSCVFWTLVFSGSWSALFVPAVAFALVHFRKRSSRL